MEPTEVTVPAHAAVEQLVASGVTHVVWLPDSESGFMYEALTEAERAGKMQLVPICREGEAIPLAMGLQLGGKRSAILIQNTGFYEAGDSLRGQAIDFKLPLVMLIGYRGWRANTAEMVDSAGIYLEPVLQAFGVPYHLVDHPSRLPRIREAFDEAERRSGPVAVLIAGEWE
jgi:sulfopyruvate decarboxylase TPP-binding subunit